MRCRVAISVLAILLAGCPSGTEKPTIRTKGSDTMFPIASAWAEAYEAAVVEVDHNGSGTGIDSLIRKTVDVALSSRPVTQDEIQLAYERTGRVPRPFVVGYDALTVYVAADNPLEEISLEELAQVFAKGGSVTAWSQLGVAVPGCSGDRIVALRRSEASGTDEIFRERVLGPDGEYRPDTIQVETTRDLLTLVSMLPCAIGYGGSVYNMEGLKTLGIKQGNSPAAAPEAGAAGEPPYPLIRPLFMYTLGAPRKSAGEFIDWVFSEEGQRILAEKGALPLRAVESKKP